MQTLASFKRGDVFQIGGTAKDPAAAKIDITLVTVRSQVRTLDGTLVAELLVSKSDQTTNKGEFSLSCLDTTAWPPGYVFIDIEQRVGSGITSSETLRLPVLEDITHD